MSEMNSFQDAFYIIAKELGFDYAQPLSPREVLEQQILPRIRELVATQPAAGVPVAWMIDWPDEPELGHYFSESPDELTGSRSRPLFTAAPPAAVPVAVGEPVYQWREHEDERWWTTSKADYQWTHENRPDFQTRILWTAPPSAAHGDEAVRRRIQQLEVLLDRCRDHVSESMELMDDYDDAEEDAGIASELIADIDAAMRAQGDGRGQ